MIDEGRDAQAVLPVLEIYSLFESIVRPFQLLLLGLTALICIVSGISILVSIYNSMSDRRHEIAVMRALGANGPTVMTIILLESILLSLAGEALGWVLGHGLNWVVGPRIGAAQTGVTIGFWNLAPPIRDLELWGLQPIMGWLSPEASMMCRASSCWPSSWAFCRPWPRTGLTCHGRSRFEASTRFTVARFTSRMGADRHR